MHETAKVYSLQNVTVTFCGVPIDGGFGSGSAIKIEKPDPDYTEVEGADGSICRCATQKSKYYVTISLLQTASGNSALAAIRAIDIATPNGLGVGPLLVRDAGGTMIFDAEKAWITAPPNADLGAEATNREWKLCADANYFPGGA